MKKSRKYKLRQLIKELCNISFNFIILLALLYNPCFAYCQNNIDHCYLFQNINNEKKFQNIYMLNYFQFNESQYRRQIINKNIDTLKKIVLVMDKIYQINKKQYNYINKIEYFLYKNFFTSKYSTLESLKATKSYLYLSYKIIKESEINSKVKLTGSYDIREQMINTLNKYYNVKDKLTLEKNLKYWEPIILNDEELKNSPDLNDLFSKKF